MGLRNLPNYRTLFVTGRGGQTRMLTPVGIDRARSVSAQLAAEPRTDEALRRPVNKEIARMEAHPAVGIWRTSGVAALDRIDMGNLLYVPSGSPDVAYFDALSRARSQASSLERRELAGFLDDCNRHLDEILARLT